MSQYQNVPRPPNKAGQIAQGVQRLLRAQNMASLTEFVLGNGRRADVFGLGPDGATIIVEIKSGPADLRSDAKWRDYIDYCDTFYFAAAPDTDMRIFPQDAGFIMADAYGGEILRPGPLRKMNAARRRATVIAFAHQAATRLQIAAGLHTDHPF